MAGMPLFDYVCRKCAFSFEQLARSSDDPDAGICPKCGTSGAERKIARFRVGGRGDLRESSDFHGCHPAIESTAGESTAGESDAHSCTSGCAHGSTSSSSEGSES
jgi:putative FmdB family regulatory protein